MQGVHAHRTAVHASDEQVAMCLPDDEVADEVVRQEGLNLRVVPQRTFLSGESMSRVAGVVCVPEHEPVMRRR